MKTTFSFARRLPDHVSDEIATVLSTQASFEFKSLFTEVFANLRKRNATSGGQEMLRLRTYEKLQNFVNVGIAERTGKEYKAIAPALETYMRESAQLRANIAAGMKGIWETGPYLHDGSAPALGDVFGSLNAGDRHGKTSQLTAREKEQLIAFLLQIDDGPLSPPPVAARPEPRASRLPGRLTATDAGIRLSLPGAYRDALITLHDVQGRQVAALFQGRSGRAGEWEWNWDGRAAGSRASGARLTAGMYTVRIRAKGAMADLALPLAWTP